MALRPRRIKRLSFGQEGRFFFAYFHQFARGQWVQYMKVCIPEIPAFPEDRKLKVCPSLDGMQLRYVPDEA